MEQYLCVGVTEDNYINILDTNDGQVDSCTPEQVVKFLENGITVGGIEYVKDTSTLRVTVQKVGV